MKKYTKKGFTLIELIIVVAIVGLLAAALFVAVDPAGRVGQARDARRYADVTAVLNAILEYTVDANALPSAISSLGDGVYAAVGPASNCSKINGGATIAETNLRPFLVDRYLSTIPSDPTYTTGSSTGYYIKKSANNRITVGSCVPHSGTTLEVQR